MVIVDSSFSSPKINDPVSVKKLSIEGDILSIDVEYSGGCKDHEFKLFFNKTYLKTLPPKANLYLIHNANGDACRELISKTLMFNISPVKHSNTNIREVIILIDGSTESAGYRY